MSILKKTLFLIPFFLLSTACTQPNIPAKGYTVPLTVGRQKIFVEIAKTLEQKAGGLSNREQITNNQGMLFDFSNSEDATPGFWMKEMNFNLDLIWIKNKKIIGITPNVPYPKSADDKLSSYYPSGAIDYVLEVNAGWSEKFRVKVGDEIQLE